MARKTVEVTDRVFDTLTDQLATLLAALHLTFTRIDDRHYAIKAAPSAAVATDELGPANNSPAATVTRRGRVVDASDGSRLPGVNVVVKESTVGNVTDDRGNYVLRVPRQATILVFSSVGYRTQEVPIDQRTTVDVRLEPEVTSLNEVVVVGYGSQARDDMTGAVDRVSAEALGQVATSSFEPLAAGRVAGLEVLQNSGQPGGGISLRIRGVNSINASGEPLYVIDGVPVNGQSSGETVGFSWAGGGEGQTAINALSFLDPRDITSLTLLKDASATAIYGARGANGVVLITTKRGESGPLQVQLDASYGVQHVPKKLEVMNLRQYNAYQRDLETAGWVRVSGNATGGASPGEGTDWQGEIFRAAPVRNHRISVRGGGSANPLRP